MLLRPRSSVRHPGRRRSGRVRLCDRVVVFLGRGLSGQQWIVPWATGCCRRRRPGRRRPDGVGGAVLSAVLAAWGRRGGLLWARPGCAACRPYVCGRQPGVSAETSAGRGSVRGGGGRAVCLFLGVTGLVAPPRRSPTLDAPACDGVVPRQPQADMPPRRLGPRVTTRFRWQALDPGRDGTSGMTCRREGVFSSKVGRCRRQKDTVRASEATAAAKKNPGNARLWRTRARRWKTSAPR